MMVSGGIIKDVLSKGKVDPYGLCSLRVKANSVVFLCTVVGESTIDVLDGKGDLDVLK